MKEKIEHEIYDTKVELGDWRSSASVLGLIRYFTFLRDDLGKSDIKFNFDLLEDKKSDYIQYHSDEITRKNYLLFAERVFRSEMHHTELEKFFEREEFSENEIKFIKEKLNGNTIMKKLFKGITYENLDEAKRILDIKENRMEIIENTFKNGISQYRNFCNPNAIFSEGNKSCRINGYSVDMPKKGKSASYMQDMNTFVHKDALEYDFIPFAFTITYDAYFINNNYSNSSLISAFNNLESEQNKRFDQDKNEKKRQNKFYRGALFESVKGNASFLDYDVEVITKNRDKDYFESLYVRDQSIEMFKLLSEKNIKVNGLFKVNEKFYIDLEKEVINGILNLTNLDNLILKLLKHDRGIGAMIKVNRLIHKTIIDIEDSGKLKQRNIYINELGGKEMSKNYKNAIGCGIAVKKSIKDKNKIKSYKNKLITAISFKDYNQFNLVLMKLSDYSGIGFAFAFDLFKDFEGNINLAYSFINALNEYSEESKIVNTKIEEEK
jgi:CRISPR-associated protein Cst1